MAKITLPIQIPSHQHGGVRCGQNLQTYLREIEFRWNLRKHPSMMFLTLGFLPTSPNNAFRNRQSPLDVTAR